MCRKQTANYTKIWKLCKFCCRIASLSLSKPKVHVRRQYTAHIVVYIRIRYETIIKNNEKFIKQKKYNAYFNLCAHTHFDW